MEKQKTVASFLPFPRLEPCGGVRDGHGIAGLHEHEHAVFMGIPHNLISSNAAHGNGAVEPFHCDSSMFLDWLWF